MVLSFAYSYLREVFVSNALINFLREVEEKLQLLESSMNPQQATQVPSTLLKGGNNTLFNSSAVDLFCDSEKSSML